MKEDSQSNKVYSELRRKILSNQLVPGTRLKEDVWATKTEVSRVSVREALNRLLGEGLLEVGEKGGYYVKSMTAADVREIREIRELLELGALRLAFNHVTDEDIAELERICDDFSAMVKNGYFSGACEADVKFHETLINMSRNVKLKHLYELSNIPLFHLKLGRSQTQMDDYELTDKEHREILKSLKAKSLKKAEEFLVKHLLRGEVASLEIE
ncbi:DNA-binding GntR family transcriptional regulator [Pedobacter africanus]|uniref:DNA-binding GntR family transcriptional regulator n=1 Tax=Pedobacter africanus TaxID=151894 RepID=A0ACC6L4J0_9SPHI|nr:GntR family transcriptional regulator [Pedobacter africanus]MDR6786308.1 DNA-binding GntR family transcriptional regulator [Pedobacter africanus]